jgi:sigma-B regulation protein RsbU (phosphoserine phosphatase)
MFVTLFIGILDRQTGELVYSNGGHNPPLLRREDTSIERLSTVHGPIVGAREGLVYGESRLRMRPNDLLLLYTDGVTEATNAKGELFSEDRLEKVLSNSSSNMCRASVDLVTAGVEQFEQGVEQSDDITVVALHFVGADSDGNAGPEVFRIRNNYDDMPIAEAKLDAVGERHGIPSDIVSKFKVILDEILSNIISYAYADENDHEIELWMEVVNNRFLLTINDDGNPFNPLTTEPPDINAPIEERELGGLGLHLVRTLADEATYQRQGDRNVLTLVKEFAKPGMTSEA